eukprot:6213565-Pleurochrysis_carterae.AAC.7
MADCEALSSSKRQTSVAHDCNLNSGSAQNILLQCIRDHMRDELRLLIITRRCMLARLWAHVRYGSG